MTITQPVKVEHKAARTGLDRIRALADITGSATDERLLEELDHTLDFLGHDLIPHALAEDQVLYPAVAVALGGEQSTATMSRDHLEIVRYAQQLRHLRGAFAEHPTLRARSDIRRVLYALEAVARLHLDEEEEIYLPLLESFLRPEAAADLVESMHEAAQRTRRRSMI